MTSDLIDFQRISHSQQPAPTHTNRQNSNSLSPRPCQLVHHHDPTTESFSYEGMERELNALSPMMASSLQTSYHLNPYSIIATK